MNKVLTAAILAALATGPAFSGSHSGGDPGVKARQAHMGLYSFHAGYLGGIAQGKAEYNAEAAQGAADALVHLTEIDQSRYWAPGTDNEAIEGTRALPALWANFGDAVPIINDLKTAAVALQAAAGEGPEAIGAAIGPVFGACTACHKAFRAPDS